MKTTLLCSLMPLHLENGGTLTADIQVGRDSGIGIFYLLDGDQKLPPEEVPDGIDPKKWNSQESDEYEKAFDALARVWGIFPGQSGRITYQIQIAVNVLSCVPPETNGVGPAT